MPSDSTSWSAVTCSSTCPIRSGCCAPAAPPSSRAGTSCSRSPTSPMPTSSSSCSPAASPTATTGLLDRTHLHFFTLESIERDAARRRSAAHRPSPGHRAGVRTPSRPSIRHRAPRVLAEALADGEAETYQFVVQAAGARRRRRGGQPRRACRGPPDRAGATSGRAEGRPKASWARSARSCRRLEPLLEEAVAHARGLRGAERGAQAHIDAMQSTRSYRMLAPFRSLFGRRG